VAKGAADVPPRTILKTAEPLQIARREVAMNDLRATPIRKSYAGERCTTARHRGRSPILAEDHCRSGVNWRSPS
jgi:hypothetical protein